MVKSDDPQEWGQAILRAIKAARADLRGSEPTVKMVAAARLHFSSYTKGLHGAQVRDVCDSHTLAGITGTLSTPESLAREAARSEGSKLRPDVNETAFRIMREAPGQAAKTKPPGERSDDEKDPVAVKRGKKGGSKGQAFLARV